LFLVDLLLLHRLGLCYVVESRKHMREGSAMAVVVKQEESLQCLLYISLYCEDYRKDSGFWEQASQFFLSTPENLDNDDSWPVGYKESCDVEDFSFFDEEKTEASEKMNDQKGLRMGRFFIVSNRGSLFGDHDHKQLL
jgi:hypothetical protein